MARSASANSGSSSSVSAPQDRAEARELADPKELSLEEVLKSYEQPINEEQAWAVCYQSCRGLRDLLSAGGLFGLREVRGPASILLHKDGTVALHTDPATPDVSRKLSPKPVPESQVVQSLGFAIYRALDWGLDESEERELSPQLERLIELMASGEGEGGGTTDEGYSGQEEEEEEEEGGPRRAVRSFRQVMAVCAARLANPSQAQAHYQAVCRALFVETLELQTFLIKIRDAKEMLKKIRDEETPEGKPAAELDNLRNTDWVRASRLQTLDDRNHTLRV